MLEWLIQFRIVQRTIVIGWVIVLFCQDIYWTFVTTGRHVFGRWYIFRDCPEWVVKKTANMADQPDDDRMQSYIQAARNEMTLRGRPTRKEES